MPAFFFISGFLNSRLTPYPRGQVVRWCRRLFPMYFLATCLALLYRRFELLEAVGLRDLPLALLTGSGWGTYYFVPVLFGALCVSIVLARFPKGAVASLAVFLPALFVVRWQWELDPMVAAWGMFGHLRSPFFWWGYFISGWIAAPYLRLHREGSPQLKLSLAALAISGIAMLSLTADWHFSAIRALFLVSASFSILLAVFYLSAKPANDLTLRLSSRTYEIYLWHVFMVDIVMHRLGLQWMGFAPGVLLVTVVIGIGIVADTLLARLSGAAIGTPAVRWWSRRSHG